MTQIHAFGGVDVGGTVEGELLPDVLRIIGPVEQQEVAPFDVGQQVMLPSGLQPSYAMNPAG